VQDRRFGYLAASVEAIDFAFLLRGWAKDVALFTDGRFSLPGEASARLSSAGIRVDERRITRLLASGGQLTAIDFEEGGPVQRDVLFVHPPQRQVDVVAALGLDLDADHLIVVDGNLQTSMPGVYAAGDLITRQQAALLAAASGMRAAAVLNHALTIDMATSGALA
jgi:thioredoxin reductase